ncbi:MAG: cytochrome P450 [Burkholderiaceae bacterium]
MNNDVSSPAPPAGSVGMRNIADLPGPRGWPVAGNLFQLDRTRPHQTVERWCEQYGSLFRMRLLKTPFLVVADHALIAGALRDRPDGFRRTPRLETTWREMGLAPGVFGANGEAWRRQRRMVMAGFDPSHVRAYFPALSRVTQRLRARWQKAARSGHWIDLQSDLMRFTVDAIAGLAFGTEINTLESDEEVIQQHLDQLFPTLSKRMLAPFPYWRHFKLPSDHRLDQGVREVNVAVQQFMAQARERMRVDPSLRQHPGNLLEAMIVAAEQPGSGVDDRDVAGNVLTMLLAGEDTTANTLAWMLHLLQGNPDAMQAVAREVRDVAARAGGGADHVFTHEQTSQLDFVEACAHETMRLKPVAPLNVMQALKDTRIADVLVPAGAMLWCVMRHDTVQESHFENPHAFYPTRWIDTGSSSAATASAKRISMPFGAGPRICPGRYLALLEMKMAIAMLFNSFDIEHIGTTDGAEPREQLSFTMAPQGLRMRLRARTPSADPPQPRPPTKESHGLLH